MRAVRRLTLVVAASLAVLIAVEPALAQIAAPTRPFAPDNGAVVADRQVRFGVLPNGMQYAILRNATPPGQASLRLRIDAGSLMEREDQRGLAHFMEHMAFNGTTRIPENELVHILERLGLAFGADTNASTDFNQTLYKLDLPRTNDETVNTALHILREQVSEALMADADIAAERGVIEGEARLRDTPGLRAFKRQIGLVAAGQRAADRMPIGDLDVIRSAPRERFVDFYNGYYRPERTTLIAVGDFDVDVMETKIRAAFESWRARGQAGLPPELGSVARRAPEVAVLVEPGVQSSVQINWTRPRDHRVDTADERRRLLLRRLGVAVLNRRLSEMTRADDPPFIAAGASESDLADSVDITSLTAQFNPGGWRRAIEAIDQEQRRLVEFGVSDAELQREIVARRTALQVALDGALTRRTPDVAASLANAVDDRTVFTSAQTNLDLFETAVTGLTTTEVNAAARSVFEGEGPLVLAVTPIPIEGGEAAVTSALEMSRRTPVVAAVAPAERAWPYDDFGAPGAVASRTPLDAVGATVVTFENGVRLTVKPTRFRDQQVLVSVRTGHGQQGFSPVEVGPESLARYYVVQGGLGQLTSDEIGRVLNDRVYSTTFAIKDDAYVLSGMTRPQDLELQTQVLAAYLTDPGLRAAPFQRIKATFPQSIAQLSSTPVGAFALQQPALLASGDRRESFPTAQDIARWADSAPPASLRQALTTGPLDVIIVGDVTVDAAIASVASTFGALPPRGEAQPLKPGADQLRFPTSNAEPIRLTHRGPAEQALAYIAWPTVDAISDTVAARRAALLAEVLKLRVTEEVREREALAYAPVVNAKSSDVYPGYGLIGVRADVGAGSIGAFWNAVDGIVARLKAAPVSQDELDRARRPILEALRRSQATNEYWSDALAGIAGSPAKAAQTMSHPADLEAVTPVDIQHLAQRYLKTDTAWRAIVTSEGAQPSIGATFRR